MVIVCLALRSGGHIMPSLNSIRLPSAAVSSAMPCDTIHGRHHPRGGCVIRLDCGTVERFLARVRSFPGRDGAQYCRQ